MKRPLLGASASKPAFPDRPAAGRLLADRLRHEQVDVDVVVGLARGGVEVALPIAQWLERPLDALAVRKVGHPLEPEYAIGAVTPDGGTFLRDGLTLPPDDVARAVDQARAAAVELDR